MDFEKWDLFIFTGDNPKLLIAGVYMMEDFVKIFNSNLDEYLDYLTWRDKYIFDTVHECYPLVVVELPFDLELYNQWLNELSLIDSEENRVSFIEHAYKHAELRSNLINKYPILPKPPVNQYIAVDVSFVKVFFGAYSGKELKDFYSPFTKSELESIYNLLIESFGFSKFEFLSCFRCQGIKPYIANRLITARCAEDNYEDIVDTFLGSEDIAELSYNLSYNKNDINGAVNCRDGIIAIGLYPILLVGDIRSVHYYKYIMSELYNNYKPFKYIEELLKNRFGDRVKVAGVIDVDSIDFWLEYISNEVFEEGTIEGISLSKLFGKKANHLRRVK